MPVVVKKRLLDLLQDNQQNYYELFVFFLDPDVSSFEKEKKARDFLVKEIDKLEMKEIDFPSDINLIKAWCENDNKKIVRNFRHI
ncbi:hypothetical protein OCUAc20_26140 [Acinetobacter baumannii]|nr:hypothetical protein E5A72_14645 [Acinetobacter baumannii ATCC 17978]BDE24114.1 hypothetical protein OCUAc20_26140 [Acinetobacter baumannii]